ncbi:hypothetical protein NPIL_215141 [Nephila pilipes]|uniref:Uncharacterized protein n=1 Tax=Nephila pilipes TaxID=299642 RepID=A0A8X6NZG2_NEPPI|nr:hypothetical protein NPIL_215141 [Nephila pilipes]
MFIILVHSIDVATKTEASDDGACVHAVLGAKLSIMLHFACRQSGSRMERYTNAELADMRLAFGALITMDESRIGCAPNAIPGGKLSAKPSLHAGTRDLPSADPSSWTQRKMREEKECQTKRRL